MSSQRTPNWMARVSHVHMKAAFDFSVHVITAYSAHLRSDPLLLVLKENRLALVMNERQQLETRTKSERLTKARARE